MLSLTKKTLRILPASSGIYQFFDNNQKILYVGKAKNLQKRVASYFRSQTDPKTSALMQHANYIKIITTATDNEALLLESTLIKKLKPKYNIFFKDDKSYPYLFLSKHKFPRLSIYRGDKTKAGEYYGPYANATAARETLHFLQKIFGLRQCVDAFFKNRGRPCIQYQIKRCTAPCVNYISEELYQQNVKLLKQFLEGKNKEIIHTLTKKMQDAAIQLRYEEAAIYREQINHLQKIQTQQYVIGSEGDLDVIGMATTQMKGEGYICILILLIRGGKVIGSESYFIHKMAENLLITNQNEIFNAFLSQYYLGEIVRFIPKKILIATPIPDKAWIEQALSEKAKYQMKILTTAKGINLRWLEMAQKNAEQNLKMHLANKQNLLNSLQNLKEQLDLPTIPKRIECFDISHTKGELTVASCVVFDTNGPVKKDYRRFNIENITKGDDYAAIEQALIKRYENHSIPDLIIIDGGKGQLHRAQITLKNKPATIIAIAKGQERKPGLEIIYTAKNKPNTLPKDSSSLHLLQQIRDEAHRFAITGHRKKLAKKRVTSVLETIYGIGTKKRRLLLEHFGGIQNIMKANIDDLTKIRGINHELAKKIYEVLHN